MTPRDAGSGLHQRIAAGLDAPVHQAVRDFAATLARDTGAVAALFYGSNLRTGELEGVLDFYLLMPGAERSRIWPRVSYHEWDYAGQTLRAKAATMALSTFAAAACGQRRDTTIWARFVQPSALVWLADEETRDTVGRAIAAAAETAARLSIALGPPCGTERDYWRALFQATYQAEFRVEKPGRENSILDMNPAHFDGLLTLALAAQGIPFTVDGASITPQLAPQKRQQILRWWNVRRRLGKPLNLLRLVRATTTFDGAARYAAWKIERHTGVPVEITPWREKHPLLAAPGVLFSVWRNRA